MLSFRSWGTHGPVLVFFHWLGGGAQTWTEVAERMAPRGVRCLALDLPGFGGSAHDGGFNIAAMTEQAGETLKYLREEMGAAGQPWVVSGHSMGGTVAMLLARHALEGKAGLEGLRGLLLVSPSPPGPEPMSNSKRSEMLGSLGYPADSEKADRKAAEGFVDNNTGKLALPPASRERAVEGVLGMNRTAFRAWLESGSKEDWSETIGKLDLPALVFAGTEDGALGPDAQRKETMPYLPEGELVVLEGAGHLAPLERPAEIVEYLTQFLTRLEVPLHSEAARPGDRIENLMHSDHTSPRTLEVMQDRLAQSSGWNAAPKVFTPAEFRTLRALAHAVVPDAGSDLAARLDAQLAEGPGDGWRFAPLPRDADAWRQGLHSLDLAANRMYGFPFIVLHGDQQNSLLEQAAAGKLGPGLLGTLHLGAGAEAYTAQAMKMWFEDVRSEMTRLYIGDPRTMDRIGYTGFADDLGFTQIQLGQQEEFER